MFMMSGCTCKPAWALPLALAVLMVGFNSVAASCNEDQIQRCSSAAVDNKLNTLEAGGVCEEQQYVAFTHVCTVTDYRPSVDFCCCTYEQRALCCRYHQGWDRFRCTESEDTVDVLSPGGLPLHFLIISIVVPIGIVLFCIFCCIRCHCRTDEDDEKTRWICWCYKRKCDKRELSDSPSSAGSGRGHVINLYSNSRPIEPAARKPLRFQPDPGTKVPLSDIPEGQRLMAVPSAPPLEEDDCPLVFPHPPGTSDGSASDGLPQCPPYCPLHHGHMHHHHPPHPDSPVPCLCSVSSEGNNGQEMPSGQSPGPGPGDGSCGHQYPVPCCCCMQHNSMHSCGSCTCSGHNSGGETNTGSPIHQADGDNSSSTQEGIDPTSSSPIMYGNDPLMAARSMCPSCSSAGGLPPPPAYEESLQHRLMD